MKNIYKNVKIKNIGEITDFASIANYEKKKKNKEKEQPRVLEQSSLKILSRALKLRTELSRKKFSRKK